MEVLNAEDRMRLFRINSGPVWGDWKFNPENLTLTWQNYYEIDLEDINSHGKLLDWLFQCKSRDIQDLMAAFTYIFEPQSKICPGGANRTFSGSKLAKAYRDKMFPKRKPLRRKPLRPKLRYLILERDGFRCQSCGASAATGAVLHVDHIHAVANGGTSDPSNLQTLCSDCNLGKGAR